MKKNLLPFFFLIAILLSGNFIFAQQQVVNKSILPYDIVQQKIAFIDSVRKAEDYKLKKEEQDNIYFKGLHQQGYTRQHIDSLHKAADPNFIFPSFYPPSDETGYHSIDQKNILQNAQKNSNTSPISSYTVAGQDQDCISGINVCAQSYTQPNSYTGYGSTQEVYNTCLLAKEQCSVWYIFTVQPGGSGTSFGFDVITSHDYDYALYDLTAIGGCSKVPTSSPIRCNFSGTYGKTGLWAPGSSYPQGSYTTVAQTSTISVSAGGAPYENGISDISMAHTYALILDNYTMDNTGYTINFTGTANITDLTPPTLSSVVNNCNGTLTINLSEQILCSSISTSGTKEFAITGPAAMTVTSESGVGCTGSLTNQILLGISSPAVSGTYTINVQNGSDANTLIDKCGNVTYQMATTQTLTFSYLAPITASASPASICAGQISTLTCTGGLGTYLWSPSGSTSSTATVTPPGTTNYQVTDSYGTCSKTSTVSVTVISKPVASISPMNPILCSGTSTTLTGSATPCVACTYSWSNGATTASITNANAGTAYTFSATSTGCSSATVTSTVSAVGSQNCNITYVAPSTVNGNPSNSGVDPANPTTIQNALANATCGAVIKMTVGTYTITNNTDLTVNSNVTIEGGYKSDFSVKYSMDNASTATYTTIIRRTNANPVSYQIIAINVNGNSSNFRLQDLRIEMPGSTTGSVAIPVNAAGSQVNNYGVYLGAGCSNYNITRCYIDIGAGAN